MDEAAHEEAVQTARSFIGEVQRSPSERQRIDSKSFKQALDIIQRLAFIRPDTGHDPFMADWCEGEWALILQQDPHDIQSRIGLGRSWLLKAQPSLSRIDLRQSENTSTQTSSAHRRRRSSFSIQLGLRASGTALSDQQRTDSPDYVYARDALKVALEHLDTALAISYQQGSLQGELLEIAAEAYLHFANVSHPRHNERYYQRALHLLQLVDRLPEHEMDPDLRDFFEMNADYIQEDERPWYQQLEAETDPHISQPQSLSR